VALHVLGIFSADILATCMGIDRKMGIAAANFSPKKPIK
jgi:hypothetical protein